MPEPDSHTLPDSHSISDGHSISDSHTLPAWARLSKSTQSYAKWGTLAGFTKERTTFLAAAGATYREELSPSNTLTLRQWIEGANWMPQIDQAHAYVVSVDWPAITPATAGWEIWIVNPTKTGWSLYLAH